MTLFLSTFINKIDKKGRVCIPASFRAALISDIFQGFVAFRSYKHQAIECCSHARIARLSESVDNLDVFSDAQDDLTAAVFADAQYIPIDGDGRAILPQNLVQYAKLGENVAFVGRGQTFQLWLPALFEDLQQQARVRMKQNPIVLKFSKSAPISVKGQDLNDG